MTTNQAIQYKDSMKVPEPTLRRLPWYLSNVKLLKQRGERYVSSTQISKEINIDASQIAKDLSYVNISGRTRVGYEVDTLIAVLEDFLGFTDMHKAFLFGVGSLGGALLRDSGLKHFGLEIVAAFDVTPELVGTTLNGIPIFHSSEFEQKMREYDVNIGVLTVPIEIAQCIIWITDSHACILIVMAVMVIFAVIANRKLKHATEKPDTFQNIIELIVEKLDGMVDSTMGKCIFIVNLYQHDFYFYTDE